MKSLLLVVCLWVTSVTAQELCAVNQCPRAEKCYNRNVAGQPNFVCECTQAGRMGHDCSRPSDNQVLTTSYGLDTGINFFASDNYPNNYGNRIRALYLLYMPGATQIQFSFDSPFAVEENKDELYVGAGLEFDFAQINGETSTTNPVDKYFFDSTVSPQPFTIFSDTAWVYFLTDKNNDEMVFSGWRLRWESPDIISPIVTRIDDISRQIPLGQNGITVFWNEPTATDDSGVVTLTSRTHSPGSFFPLGTTTVTYTYTDGSGNSASTSFDVIVTRAADTTPPVITPINDVTATIELGTATATIVSWTEPTATDDSGTVTLTSKTRNPGSSFVLGTTPVTYTFSDPSGNTASLTFNVNVVTADTTPPVISPIGDVTVTVVQGTANIARVSWTEPTATDLSGTASLVSRTSSPNSFFPIGTTPVTYTFTDPSGNTASYTFNVNVVEVDGTGPVIEPVDDITVTVPFGTSGRTVSWTEPTATDDSGIATLTGRTSSPNSFFPVGTTQVTYTFTDGSGNEASMTFNVNVVEVDDTRPVITPVSDITVTVPVGTSGRTVSWTEPTATDDSGTATLTGRTISPNSFFPVGSTPVTYSFTDGSGNTASITFNVNVVEVDDRAPNIIPLDDITVTVPLGTPGRTVNWIEPSATDDSGTATLTSRTNSPNSYFPVGTTPVTYTFTDPSGNAATMTFYVNVVEVDTSSPVITPINDITVTVSVGTPGRTVTWTEPSATDDSGTATLIGRTGSPNSFFPVGSTPVTYTFTDGSGNTASMTFNVNVVEVDDHAPNITPLEDITVTVSIGTPGRTVSWVEPSATDDSGTATLTSRTNSPNSYFPVGTTPVTYTYTDPSGNAASITFNVNVVEVDDRAPSITPLDDITVTVPLGTPGRTVNWIEPSATDDSGTATLTSRTNTPNSYFPVGTTPVTYTFTDPSGNAATMTFYVNVVEVDDRAPNIIPLDDITVTVPLGTPGRTVNWIEPSATDDSGTATLTSRTNSPNSYFPVGTTPVTYTFTDPSGNTATMTFYVNIVEVDDIPPVIVCADDISETTPLGSGGKTISWVEPTATDNSGVATLESRSNVPGSFFVSGSTAVTYRFVDESGNGATCTFTILITEVDTVAPVINCIEDIFDTVELGTSGTVVTWTEPTATDNSGIVTRTSRTTAPGSFFVVGSNPVSYTFVDGSGNSATCAFTVTIAEVDTVAPIVSCPADIALTIKTGETATAVEFVEPTATDNSGVANMISRSHPSGALFVLGATQVNYRFTDNSGNVGSCSFNVDISDADPCFNIPCLNGGVCVVESLMDYSCICPECYSGNTCEIAADACAQNQCSNGANCLAVAGTCTAYSCECPACFLGQYCRERVNPCNNNQCANGAQCVPDLTGCTTYYCQCPPCYQGEFCQYAIDACSNHRCENGGICVPTLNGACSEYKCSCSGCNTGQYCEISRSPCARNPCGNNGACFQLPGSCTAYTCECPGCFTGFNCELVLASPCLDAPCQNGGQCNAISGQCFSHSCICQQGFSGTYCQSVTVVNMNPCTSFPCGNGGSCVTMDATYYVCLCRDGYAGTNCQLNLDNTSSFYDACGLQQNQRKCSNGGTCYNSFNSNNNGNFVPQYTCMCTNGFSGIGCTESIAISKELDICSVVGRPRCENGGVCYNTYHAYDNDVDYTCDCLSGFIGHNCETVYNNPCISNPCLNGGQCTDFGSYFTCACPNGYIGNNCNIETSIDNIPPIVSNVPNSIYVYTDNVGTNVDWDEPLATDNAGVANLIRRTSAPGSYFPLGTTPVSYVFADSSNNAVSVVFFVTVLPSTAQRDTIPPVISNCPTGVSVTAAAGASSAIVFWDIPTATDNSGALPTMSSSRNPGEAFSIGTTSVSTTFMDGSGNRASCVFVVTVTAGASGNDITPPVISGCPSNIVAAATSTFTLVEWTAPTAIDDSGEATLTFSNFAQPRAFVSRDMAPLLVMYTFSDQSGNEQTCEFTISASESGQVDSIAPIISGCPTGVSVNAFAGSTAQVSWTPPSATDNSLATPTLSQSHVPGDAFPVGNTLVTYTFSDAAGNAATCSFSVIVSVPSADTTPPVISSCPAVTSVTADEGSMTALVSWVPPTATDNSGLPVTQTRSHAPGSAFLVGTTVVTYVFTDASGNVATCRFNVIVTPAMAGNPCTSNPCGVNLSCFYTANLYICLPPVSRKRRDADEMWTLYE